VADTASEEIVMEAVWALCEFSLLVTQQNPLDRSLNALDDALKRFHQKKAIFREQKMLKSGMAKVDDLLAWESHLFHEQIIHKICAAMDALVYGAEMVSTTKCGQFQLRQNRAWQVATAW